MFGGPPAPDEELKAHWQSKEEIAASTVALMIFMPVFTRRQHRCKDGEKEIGYG
jgi:hypothetical protein